MTPRTVFHLEVNPKIPRRLARLEELANNLWYSWDRPTRTLFARLHPGLWDAVGHNPKAFLKRIDEKLLTQAAEDPVFLAYYNHILSAYDSYHSELVRRDGQALLGPDDLVAYFCAEFGFHESFPIYSGGLGILAGDHCKTASDMRLPFIGVGLLYRQGYFHQSLDSDGNQHAQYTDSDFDDLPVAPVIGPDGKELRVAVELPGRSVSVKVWQARVGHVTLYLLDTDLEENRPDDRDISHRLYGGDRTMRLEQELVLGVGGVRALAALGLKPIVYHVNEGHAAFLVLERVRMLMSQGLDFAAALEAVAVSTVFTTHTPVPAGHDHFSDEMILTYFDWYLKEVKILPEELLALGRTPGSSDFNMTALAVRGSRFHNGVSRIHGEVSARILQGLWPQIEPEENPMESITNGVHVPTFLFQDWADVFDKFLGNEWRNRLCDDSFWARIDEIPDHLFWSTRQSLKSQMLYLVRHRVRIQHFRNHGSEAHLERLLKYADPINPHVLTIGFARRFATYKRALLLFQDLEWLKQIVSDPERPVLFIFAGKAHPADEPGQALIRRVAEIARMPEFEGKILLVENYDLRLARRLVSGVDVWLNNPIYPQEACGTSGMKAAINGVINLSVTDGWWGEGYDGKNGWAIKPAPESMDPARRDREESRTLYEILQDQVLPLYYQRGKQGYPVEWVKLAKRSIASILPRFNSVRMVGEYVQRFYAPAARQGAAYAQNRFESARAIAAWKSRVRRAWPGVRLQRLDTGPKRIQFGSRLTFKVVMYPNGLEPDDVVVELLIGRTSKADRLSEYERFRFRPEGAADDPNQYLYTLDLEPSLCGKLNYMIRAYPCHPLLTHPLEMGMMVWL
ncbi:alpha-glucan family phosphorylase [Pelomicrobium sp. G1]|uniref:alpha-glucan family phosphorylase n=1 Tax=unclassified Pelomicrobium TaxID=2815318 RepID=UPI003F77609D